MKKTLKHQLELSWLLAKTDFKLRYHGSMLGILWVLLKPLSTFLVLNFVFSYIFPTEKQYSVYLFIGIVLWNFFAEGTMSGLHSLFYKSHVISKISIPKWVIVFSTTLNALFNFILYYITLLVVIYMYGIYPSFIQILVSLFFCFLVYILVFAFSLIFSPLFIRIRDLNQIWDVMLMAGFYATPVIFPLKVLPENIQYLLFINPVTLPLVQMREVLIDGKIVRPEYTYLYIVFLVLLLFIAQFLFQKYSKNVTEYI